MRHLLTLAAAAFLAVGCAGNKADETGAAPDQGADPSVTATDTTTTTPTDSTMGQVPADTGFVQQDTTAADPGMGVDSTQTVPGAEADTAGAMQTDTTSTGAWTDSTAAGVPAATTAAGTSDTTADSTVSQ